MECSRTRAPLIEHEVWCSLTEQQGNALIGHLLLFFPHQPQFGCVESRKIFLSDAQRRHVSVSNISNYCKQLLLLRIFNLYSFLLVIFIEVVYKENQLYLDRELCFFMYSCVLVVLILRQKVMSSLCPYHVCTKLACRLLGRKCNFKNYRQLVHTAIFCCFVCKLSSHTTS